MNVVEMGGGTPEEGCYWAERENGEIIKKDRKDSVIHLPESLMNSNTKHLR